MRLDTGMQVVTCSVPGRPLASAILLLEAGAMNEPSEKEGVAALAARALSEGTEGLDAEEFADAVERLGAEFNARAGTETITVNVVVPKPRLVEALTLLADAARRPTFPEREVARLREERINNIRQQMATPGSRAMLSFFELAYAHSSRYARPTEGTSETVERLTRDDLEEYYGRFATPASATVILAADLDGLDVHASLSKLFEDWQTPEPERPRPVVEPAIDATEVRLVDRPGSVQSNFVLGHIGIARNAPDYHAIQLLEHALGGSFNSRINRKLREEKGYTYGARAGFDARRQEGPFYAHAAVETSVTAPAVNETIVAIEEMRQGGPSEDELNAAQKYLTGIFGLRFETPDGIASGLAELVLHELPDDYFDRYADALRALDVAAVAESARARLHPDRLAVSIVGDADVVADDLRAAGFDNLHVVRDQAN